MKLPLAYFGDSVLRTKGRPVEEMNDEVRQLVHDMIETMESNNGVGLAAPQVHRSLTLFVACGTTDGKWDRNKVRVFINPKIISCSTDTHVSNEGCLSIPKLYGDVMRPNKVVVSARNMEWEEFTVELTDLEANVFFHENDHINGVLFIDRIHGKQRKDMEPSLKAIKKKFAGKASG